MKVLNSEHYPVRKNGNKYAKLREVDTHDTFEFEGVKFIRLQYTDGEVQYAVTLNDGFVWLDFNQKQLDNFHMLLNTLKEDGEI